MITGLRKYPEKFMPCYQMRMSKQRCIVAYLDGLRAKVNALRELQSPALRFEDATQSASGEELRPLFFAKRRADVAAECFR